MIAQNALRSANEPLAEPIRLDEEKVRIEGEQKRDEFFDAVKFANVAVARFLCDDVIGELEGCELVFDLDHCRIGDLHLNDRLIRTQLAFIADRGDLGNIVVVVFGGQKNGEDEGLGIIKALFLCIVFDGSTQLATQIVEVALCLAVGDPKPLGNALRVGVALHRHFFMEPLDPCVGAHTDFLSLYITVILHVCIAVLSDKDCTIPYGCRNGDAEDEECGGEIIDSLKLADEKCEEKGE